MMMFHSSVVANFLRFSFHDQGSCFNKSDMTELEHALKPKSNAQMDPRLQAGRFELLGSGFLPSFPHTNSKNNCPRFAINGLLVSTVHTTAIRSSRKSPIELDWYTFRNAKNFSWCAMVFRMLTGQCTESFRHGNAHLFFSRGVPLLPDGQRSVSRR